LSIHSPEFRHWLIFSFSVFFPVEKMASAPTLLQRRNRIGAENERSQYMKYILLMTGTKEGVDAYKSWSEKDIQTHFAHLTRIRKDLSQSGEFVSTEGLGMPQQAKVVRAGKDSLPITDGVFPEAKEFVLGYWIVDVETAERAYEIAALLSGGPGPGGIRLNMPIEVRQIMTRGSGEVQ
jgi:hypothetical protein